MAILQALFALITRSAGKILNAIFGWAVKALFGRTSSRDQTLLSALVAGAVAWPLLVAGIAAPRIAALALAFVPLPRSVPSWIVRIVWLALSALVPVALGLTIAARNPPSVRRDPFIVRLLRGFPMTLGLAAAFIVMFVSVPVMRFAALVRREKSADVPLATDTAGYHQVARRVIEALNRHGLRMAAAEPGWWVKAPMRILSFFGGTAFAAFVPQNLEHDVGPGLSVSFYPSGVLLRGQAHKVTLAHGLIAETVVHSSGLQTSDAAAQDLERQIRQVWAVHDQAPEAHAGAPRLLARVDELGRALTELDVDYDDWQVIHRQLLQLDRAVRGHRQLLDAVAVQMQQQEVREGQDRKEEGAMSIDENASGPRPEVAALSTAELVKQITQQVGELARAQIQLATTELRANIKSEVKMATGLGVSALAALMALNLLLVTAVLALAAVMPGWAAGLIVTGVMAVVTAIAGLVGWRKRVRHPLERTRHELKEDVQWTKERLV